MERAERDLAIQYAVTNTLASAVTLVDAARQVLTSVCDTLGWRAGGFWVVDTEPGVLRCLAVVDRSERAADFAGASATITLPPGIGLPGRVWSRAEPLWIHDVTAETNFRRAPWAARAGLRSGFAVPVDLRGAVVGVLEFYDHDLHEPDPELLRMFAAVGVQLGLAMERLQGRETLAASESRLRAVIEGAPDALIMIDQDGRIIEWNRRAEELFGWSREEAANRPIATTIVPERYRDQHRAGLARFVRTREGPFLNRRLEIEALHRDGYEIPVELQITPVLVPDGYVFSAFLRDIRERRRSEERQRFLAEAGAILAGSLDFETTLARVAQLALAALADICVIHLVDDRGVLHRVTTMSTEPELDRRWRALNVPAEIDSAAEHPAARVFRTRQSLLFDSVGDTEIEQLEHTAEHGEFLRSLGLRQWYCAPLVVHGDALGVMGFAVCRAERRWTEPDIALAEEIARRAALAVENARLYRQAKDAVRTRDEFLSTVSHDLRNPLASIKGLAQLLHRRAQRLGTPETLGFVESLTRIDAAATRMTRLLDELVEVAGLRIGQPLELSHQAVDLVALAREVAASVRSDEHHVEIEAPEPAVIAEGDPSRLQRVLMNLVANAFKYSGPGTPVSVSVERHDGAAVIAVSDRGRGIPAADLPYIFERFRRGSNVEGISGTGIGLTAAKQIVELHGGTISVESTEGSGSRFIVRLPLPGNEPADAKG